MPRELELWRFIAGRLHRGERVMLLIVGESSGSSPGRAGYKMAVAENGELIGSIGGGLMEVNLVEEAKRHLSSREVHPSERTWLVEQEHRTNSKNPSGMICSGRQTVILNEITPDDLRTVDLIVTVLPEGGHLLLLGKTSFAAGLDFCGTRKLMPPCDAAISFELRGDDFIYSEELNAKGRLIIIGGGHCALALSELMAKMDFHVSIFDDRPSLNTLEKNEFADSITLIDGYDNIAAHVRDGDDAYIVVMTLGYASDAVVIRQLIEHDVRYFGVLGSKAKMRILMTELKREGLDAKRLARIHTPIGLSINSRTPEEIAISIAAEIISVKNT